MRIKSNARLPAVRATLADKAGLPVEAITINLPYEEEPGDGMTLADVRAAWNDHANCCPNCGCWWEN